MQNASQLYPTATGSEEGLQYAEFSTSTLTGGGLGYTIGENSVILPVELLSFEAMYLGDAGVLTQWATASEVHNDYFLVERSSDLDRWEWQAKIKGAGTSNVYHYYKWVDEEPLSGHSYYRLRQVDLYGTSTLSEVRDVYIAGGDLEIETIRVYPNPSNAEVNIEVRSTADVSLELRNSMGQVIRDLKVHTNETLTLYDLAAGVYYLAPSKGFVFEPIRFVVTK